MKKVLYFSTGIGIAILVFYSLAHLTFLKPVTDLPTSGAGVALDAWASERLYPSNQLPSNQWYKAFEERTQTSVSRNNLPKWEAIGPKNIAGRTLALAFHPTDSKIIYLGSAGGGLWKTETAGLGANAWERIPTGFPILGVGAIVINPQNPNQLFIGTGEVYNTDAAELGVIDRLTRGTYGMGILKTEDGGQTWSKSLDWSYQSFTGVQDLLFHPIDTNIIYAATTEGLYQTSDGGDNWTNIHEERMAVDIAIHQKAPATIFVTHGSLYYQNSGIFRSTDAGENFEQLSTGLPNSYSGKTMLAFHPSSPNEIYASVSHAFGSIGLFRSEDAGDSWRIINREDVAKWQGWYSHDIASNPSKPNEMIYVGIDSWHSTNRGVTFDKKGDFEDHPLGKPPINGPDGPTSYVHSDIHRAYFHPLVDNLVFLATDGGVFVSTDGGKSFESRNGGLQTTQFYANFSNSTTDSLFAIGGMQDNWTAIYDGTGAWSRVIGGDGMTTAIDPLNDRILYGSAQYGYFQKSTNRGRSFNWFPVGGTSTEFDVFNVPFEIAPSSPSVLYSANKDIIRSTNRGVTWDIFYSNVGVKHDDILTIAVAPLDEYHLLYSTVPGENISPIVLHSKNGGRTATVMTGLPNLVAKDFAFHPNDDQIMYAVFSGYGDAHFWKTEDGGTTWTAPADNLPDLPHHSILVDPLFPDHLYVGTDLGVYFSEDGGSHWEGMMTGLPEAIYAINLSYSPANRKIRVATHGNGIYEAPMVFDESNVFVSTFDLVEDNSFTIAPNPIDQEVAIRVALKKKGELTLQLYDVEGKFLQTLYQQRQAVGEVRVTKIFSTLPSGFYLLQLSLEDSFTHKKQVLTKKLVKK